MFYFNFYRLCFWPFWFGNTGKHPNNVGRQCHLQQGLPVGQRSFPSTLISGFSGYFGRCIVGAFRHWWCYDKGVDGNDDDENDDDDDNGADADDDDDDLQEERDKHCHGGATGNNKALCFLFGRKASSSPLW